MKEKEGELVIVGDPVKGNALATTTTYTGWQGKHSIAAVVKTICCKL
ncbi:hypothetical protein [Niabella hibiscisoli]|nr:hypothetical protein [Niabella hibiscisoli]MCH5714813.1 hypothetical protein [Niabella hibiscisoli]